MAASVVNTPATSVTSADVTMSLTIANLFATAVPIQGFAPDEATDIPEIVTAEEMMGVDGFFTAGFVFVPFVQTIVLMADSPSFSIFDQWQAVSRGAPNTYWASETLIMPGINTAYTFTQGVLTRYKPAPDVRRLLQPRRYEIRWGGFSAAPYQSTAS